MVADRETESRVREGRPWPSVSLRAVRSRSTGWPALGDVTPLSRCATEAGAQLVRRILRAIESGGVV